MYLFITSSMKKDIATQNSNVLINMMQESYVENKVNTWMPTLEKSSDVKDGTRRLSAKTEMDLKVKKRNLSLVMYAWNMYLEVLTATRSMNTEM